MSSRPPAPGSVRVPALVSLLLFVAMTVTTWPLTPGIPAIQFTFTEPAFRAVLAQWTPSGVALFKAHFLMDFPFLLSYAALGQQLATRTTLFARLPTSARMRLALTLPLAAVADAAENCLHLFLLCGDGPFARWLYAGAGAVASVKWLLIGVFVVCALMALFLKPARTLP